MEPLSDLIPIGWPILVGAFCATALGAMIQSIAGFGLGLLAGPTLAALDPALVPAPVLIVTFALGCIIVVRDWGRIAWQEVGLLTGGRWLGALPAAALVAYVNLTLFYIIFGIMVLVGVALSLAGRTARFTNRNLLLAGVGSGVMGTFASIGAPPILMVYQQSRTEQARGTLAVVFGIGGLLSVLALTIFGEVGAADLVLAAILLPAVVVGFALARPVGRMLAASSLRWFAIGASTLAAFYLIGRGLMQLL